MDIKQPFAGFPQTLLWTIFGLICLILGVYFITLYGFQESFDVNTLWTILGIIIILIGLFIIPFNIAVWIIKIIDLYGK